MIGALYALCAYLFNCEIVQESGGALADFAYYEKVWQWRCPAGRGGGVRPRAGDGVFRPRGGDGDTPFRRVWGCTPHSLFSVLPEKRECAVHGGREKRALWSSRKCPASIEGRSVNLLCGRRDFFLFPRFAPGWFRLGWDSAPILSEGPGLCAGPGGRRGWR